MRAHRLCLEMWLKVVGSFRGLRVVVSGKRLFRACQLQVDSLLQECRSVILSEDSYPGCDNTDRLPRSGSNSCSGSNNNRTCQLQS